MTSPASSSRSQGHHAGIPEIVRVYEAGRDEILLRHQSAIEQPFQIDRTGLTEPLIPKDIDPNNIGLEKVGEIKIAASKVQRRQGREAGDFLQSHEPQPDHVADIHSSPASPHSPDCCPPACSGAPVRGRADRDGHRHCGQVEIEAREQAVMHQIAQAGQRMADEVRHRDDFLAL